MAQDSQTDAKAPSADFRCGYCGLHMHVKPELLGRRAKCPKCGHVGKIGSAAEAEEPMPLTQKEIVEAPRSRRLSPKRLRRSPRPRRRKQTLRLCGAHTARRKSSRTHASAFIVASFSTNGFARTPCSPAG